MEFVNLVIFPALITILTGVFSYGVTVLVDLLKEKTKNEKIRAALDNARDIIAAEVAATAQIYVDDLKKNGEFSTAKQREAFSRTLERIERQLTAEAADAVNEITDDAQAWLIAEIEKAVKNSKKEG